MFDSPFGLGAVVPHPGGKNPEVVRVLPLHRAGGPARATLKSWRAGRHQHPIWQSLLAARDRSATAPRPASVATAPRLAAGAATSGSCASAVGRATDGPPHREVGFRHGPNSSSSELPQGACAHPQVARTQARHRSRSHRAQRDAPEARHDQDAQGRAPVLDQLLAHAGQAGQELAQVPRAASQGHDEVARGTHRELRPRRRPQAEEGQASLSVLGYILGACWAFGHSWRVLDHDWLECRECGKLLPRRRPYGHRPPRA
jgi:hypothetical protein